MESQVNGIAMGVANVGFEDVSTASTATRAPSAAGPGQQEPKMVILLRPKLKKTSPSTPTPPGSTPAGNGDGNGTDPNNTKTKPAKSLEQREQEYAEARQRILGDVRFLEEEREVEMETRMTPAEILKMKIQEALKADAVKAEQEATAKAAGENTSAAEIVDAPPN